MKKFVNPEIEVQNVEVEDVITTSCNLLGGETPED